MLILTSSCIDCSKWPESRSHLLSRLSMAYLMHPLFIINTNLPPASSYSPPYFPSPLTHLFTAITSPSPVSFHHLFQLIHIPASPSSTKPPPFLAFPRMVSCKRSQPILHPCLCLCFGLRSQMIYTYPFLLTLCNTVAVSIVSLTMGTGRWEGNKGQTDLTSITQLLHTTSDLHSSYRRTSNSCPYSSKLGSSKLSMRA